MTDIVLLMTDASRRTPGELLHHVIEFDHGVPPSIADLARYLGWSESKTLREADRLVENGLLIEERAGRSRLLRANRSSPFYGPVLESLFLAYGTTEPDRDRLSWLPRGVGAVATGPLPEAVRPHVPEELWPRPAATDTGQLRVELNDGPTLAQARGQALALVKLARPASHLHSALQTSYGRWHEERDRDLIHRVLHLGAGVQTARHVLIHSAHTAQYLRAPSQPRIPSSVWALAVFCVQAERTLLRAWLVDWCAEGLQLTYERAGLEQRLAAAIRDLESSDRVDQENGITNPRRGEIQARIQGHRNAISRADTDLAGHYEVGGTPSRDSIGRAGERIIVTAFEPVIDALGQHVDEMAAHPAFQGWREQLPVSP